MVLRNSVVFDFITIFTYVITTETLQTSEENLRLFSCSQNEIVHFQQNSRLRKCNR